MRTAVTYLVILCCSAASILFGLGVGYGIRDYVAMRAFRRGGTRFKPGRKR